MDEIDRRKAARFAWRVLGPEELEADALSEVPPEEEPEPQEEDRSQESLEEFRARAHRDCRGLAKHVDAVWGLAEGLQAKQMPALIEHVDQIGLEIGALEEEATLKLARLWVRHWSTLGSALRKPVFLLPMAGFDHPDLPLLLAEIAVRGNSHMAYVVEHALGDEEIEFPGLAYHLGKVIESPSKPQAALIALRWLAWCEQTEAKRWLRSAIRLPHLPRRVEALHAAGAHSGEILLDEDVLWLLEDAVLHPLPYDHGRGSYDDAYYYANALSSAVKAMRPAGGEKPLLRILRGECSYYKRDRWTLDAGWALGLLAGAYPEVALPYIDLWLTSTRWNERLAAVRAAAALSPSEARPRLLRVAGDGSSQVYSEVQTQWQKLFEEKCPAAVTAGVDRALISDPESPRLAHRLAIARGDDREALLELARELLAPEEPPQEQPDLEGLAVLLVALDGTTLTYGTKEFPTGRGGWVKLLAQRFGQRAIEAIVHRASREGKNWYDSWGHALQEANREGVLDDAARALLRQLATGFLRAKVFERQDLLCLLSSIGAPPDIVQRVFGWLVQGQTASSEDYWIHHLLGQQTPSEEMRMTLRTRIDEACGSLDTDILVALAPLAASWKDPVALDRLALALDALGHEITVPKWVSYVARALHTGGKIDAAWREERLAHPETTVFSVAADYVRKDMTATERALLFAAIDSRAREGGAAAEALAVLLFYAPGELTEERIQALVLAAPPFQQAELAHPLLRSDTWFDWVPGWTVDLLAIPDEAVHDAIIDVVWSISRRDEADAMLKEGIKRQPDLALRDHLCRVLRVPSSTERYWIREERDEEDEDDFEDDEGEEDDEEGMVD